MSTAGDSTVMSPRAEANAFKVGDPITKQNFLVAKRVLMKELTRHGLDALCTIDVYAKDGNGHYEYKKDERVLQHTANKPLCIWREAEKTAEVGKAQYEILYERFKNIVLSALSESQAESMRRTITDKPVDGKALWDKFCQDLVWRKAGADTPATLERRVVDLYAKVTTVDPLTWVTQLEEAQLLRQTVMGVPGGTPEEIAENKTEGDRRVIEVALGYLPRHLKDVGKDMRDRMKAEKGAGFLEFRQLIEDHLEEEKRYARQEAEQDDDEEKSALAHSRGKRALAHTGQNRGNFFQSRQNRNHGGGRRGNDGAGNGASGDGGRVDRNGERGNRSNHNDSKNGSRDGSGGRSRGPTCFVCDVQGHVAKECPNRAKFAEWMEQQQKEGEQ